MVIVNNIGLMVRIQIIDGVNFWILLIVNLLFDLVLFFIIILMIYVEGICCCGIKKYLKVFVILGFMILMNFLEEVINFFLFVLWVFGNIFVGEVMVSMLVLFFYQVFYWYFIVFGINLIWIVFFVFIFCV